MFTDNTPFIFKIVGTIVPILVFCGFGFTFAMLFSPKLRAKVMGHQLKAQKYMLEQNKDTLADLSTTAAEIGISSQKQILDNNAEVMEELSTKNAEIKSAGIEKMARAVKKGLTEEVTLYCKHCGSANDTDSAYCKKCGKKQ